MGIHAHTATTIQLQVTSNFALTHLSAAKLFARKTAEIENASLGQPFGDFFGEISIYCASCIVCAAASLEALINELFIMSGPLRNAVPDFETFFWGDEERKGFERKPPLKKYKRATRLLEGNPLSTDDAEYDQADSLLGFRNYLVHFKPLWHERPRDTSLETQLRGRFAISPFFGEQDEFLARQCISAGCADWAVRTVVEFIRYFARNSGLEAADERYRQKLRAFQ